MGLCYRSKVHNFLTLCTFKIVYITFSKREEGTCCFDFWGWLDPLLCTLNSSKTWQYVNNNDEKMYLKKCYTIYLYFEMTGVTFNIENDIITTGYLKPWVFKNIADFQWNFRKKLEKLKTVWCPTFSISFYCQFDINATILNKA